VNWNAYSDPILAVKTHRKLYPAARVMADGKVCQSGRLLCLTRDVSASLSVRLLPSSFRDPWLWILIGPEKAKRLDQSGFDETAAPIISLLSSQTLTIKNKYAWVFQSNITDSFQVGVSCKLMKVL
jgi:hypothetical protein